MSYNSASKYELLALTYQGTSYPHKVIPWLAQNKYKINTFSVINKLFTCLFYKSSK